MKNYLFVLIFLLGGLGAYAQNIASGAEKIPADPSVRIGKLENGMTYYICHCDKPAERGEFYIVHNVGAMQEEDNQNGLAHFLEHMAFNGTAHFPKKTMLEYLASIGVRFGANVNAFTSRTMTAYNISAVPLIRESIVDSVLLMLHDWSGYISCEPEEIEAERGVIREEWRRKQIMRTRLNDQLAPVLYNHSKFVDRSVLGDYDIIMNFKRQTLLDFYHKWYRPDLQAVIIVGDFDVHRMEQKVKTAMSRLPKAENPAPKITYTVPDNEEPLAGIATDPGAAVTIVKIVYKQKVPAGTEKQKVAAYRTELKQTIIAELFKKRMTALKTEKNQYVMQKSVSYGELTPDTKNLFIMGTVKNGKVLPALRDIALEVERVRRFGFTDNEWAEIKARMIRDAKQQGIREEARKAGNIVKACMDHFAQGAPLMSGDYKNRLFTAQMEAMSLEEINGMLPSVFSRKNVVINVIGPQKEGLVYPTEQQLVKVVKEAWEAEVEPYVFRETERKPLMVKKPEPGRIVGEKAGAFPGSVEWTLSNGAKVVLKTLEVGNAQLNFYAFSEGGRSLVAEKDLPSVTVGTQYYGQMGIAGFSLEELSKINAGKMVSLIPALTEYYEIFKGGAAVKDAETLLQMVNLYFTQPRFDQQEFRYLMEKTKNLLINRKGLPKVEYQNEVAEAKYAHHPRRKELRVEDTAKIDFQTVRRIYLERFADPGSFTFIFTGNIKPEELKPFVETYLASLPSKKVKEGYEDRHIRLAKGEIVRHTELEMPTPKATVDILYSGKLKCSMKNHIIGAALQYILSDRYTKTVREEKGGTYHVAVNVDEITIPENEVVVEISFETSPDKAEELAGLVQKEVDVIAGKAPAQTELANARQYYEKYHKGNISSGNYWLNVLSEYYKSGLDLSTDYEKTWDSITPEDVRGYAQKVFGQKNKMEFILKSK